MYFYTCMDFINLTRRKLGIIIIPGLDIEVILERSVFLYFNGPGLDIVVSREQSLASLEIIISAAWLCMGGLEWGAWYGGPGIVRNVPNPDSPSLRAGPKSSFKSNPRTGAGQNTFQIFVYPCSNDV